MGRLPPFGALLALTRGSEPDNQETSVDVQSSNLRAMWQGYVAGLRRPCGTGTRASARGGTLSVRAPRTRSAPKCGIVGLGSGSKSRAEAGLIGRDSTAGRVPLTVDAESGSPDREEA